MVRKLKTYVIGYGIFTLFIRSRNLNTVFVFLLSVAFAFIFAVKMFVIPASAAVRVTRYYSRAGVGIIVNYRLSHRAIVQLRTYEPLANSYFFVIFDFDFASDCRLLYNFFKCSYIVGTLVRGVTLLECSKRFSWLLISVINLIGDHSIMLLCCGDHYV